MDCHIETYRDKGDDARPYRAKVIHTASQKTLYTTWRYSGERAALWRAWRWLKDEYRQWPRTGLFDNSGSQLPGIGSQERQRQQQKHSPRTPLLLSLGMESRE